MQIMYTFTFRVRQARINPLRVTISVAELSARYYYNVLALKLTIRFTFSSYTIPSIMSILTILSEVKDSSSNRGFLSIS